jgi:hypothetical protein
MVHSAHAWRLPLYLELGEMAGVEADIDALTRVNADIRQRTYWVSMLGYRIMLALLRGEFTDAERLILEFQALLRGLTVHADQLSMQIFTFRREQGRLAALQPVMSMFLRQHAAASVSGGRGWR